MKVIQRSEQPLISEIFQEDPSAWLLEGEIDREESFITFWKNRLSSTNLSYMHRQGRLMPRLRKLGFAALTVLLPAGGGAAIFAAPASETTPKAEEQNIYQQMVADLSVSAFAVDKKPVAVIDFTKTATTTATSDVAKVDEKPAEVVATSIRYVTEEERNRFKPEDCPKDGKALAKLMETNPQTGHNCLIEANFAAVSITEAFIKSQYQAEVKIKQEEADDLIRAEECLANQAFSGAVCPMSPEELATRQAALYPESVYNGIMFKVTQTAEAGITIEHTPESQWLNPPQILPQTMTAMDMRPGYNALASFTVSAGETNKGVEPVANNQTPKATTPALKLDLTFTPSSGNLF
jgi:hypothetical protein